MKIEIVRREYQYFLLIVIFSFLSFMSQGKNAPVTSIGSILNALPGEEITLPVTVNGFENISGFTLSIDYEYAKLKFVSGTKNSLLGGTCDIGDIDLGNGFHRLTISWYKSGIVGITLPEGSSIVDYVFKFISGPATLTWFDIGPSCVFNDPNANTLNDIPTSFYYNNGLVSDSELSKPTITASGSTTFFEGDSLTLSSSSGTSYLWSTGDTTSSIVVKESGSYTVRIKNGDGQMSESSNPIQISVISFGSNQLNFRLTNPRIINETVNNYLEFDVQIRSDVGGSYLWKGEAVLGFESVTFSSRDSYWLLTPGALFNENNSLGNKKYNFNLSVSNSIVGINYEADFNAINLPASKKDFVKVTTNYVTLVSVRGKIISNSGVAGIRFIKNSMNGKQFYKLNSSPWYESFTTSNYYDPGDLSDIYVSRIYSLGEWTQVFGVDWSKTVNSSVWKGNASIPEGNISYSSNLRIHEPATLSIPANGSMTTSGNTEIKTTNGLIIQSDETGIGSFITSTSNGSAAVRRYITADTHLISSPLSGQSIISFLEINSNISSSEDFQFRYMSDFNPELKDWNDYFTNNTSGILESGKGYYLHTESNGTINFFGSLQAGDVKVNGISGKLNCLGNPYSSSICLNSTNDNSSNFLLENAESLDPMYGAIYLWNQPNKNNGYLGNYTVISNATESCSIQQGEAFFVKLNSVENNVNFRSVMQIHKSSIINKTTTFPNQTIKLKVSSKSLNSSTVIAFINGMTKGIDPTYDAGLIKGNLDLIVYSYMAENKGIPFAIQALPTKENNLIIPLGLEFGTGGEVTFSAESINLINDKNIILEDKESKIFIDLSIETYTVNIAPNSFISDRFQIHASDQSVGTNCEVIFDIINVFAIGDSKLIINGTVNDETSARLYNLQGRLLLFDKLNKGSYNELNISGIKTGIYILLVKDKRKVQSFKIAIND